MIRALRPRVFFFLIAAAGLGAGSCNIRPIVLDDPLLDLDAAADAPIDAMTTASLSSLRFSYLELPGAQEEATSAPETLGPLEPLPLSISDAVALTFQNDLSIKITDIGRAIAADQIEEQKGIYDLLLNASASTAEARGKTSTSAIDPITGFERDQDDVDLPDSKMQSDLYTAGVSQLVDSGGRLSVNAVSARTSIDPSSIAPDPAYEQSYIARFDQPLLRNFGPGVTRAGIRIAQNNKKIAYQEWRQTAMSEVLSVMNRYWDLVFAVNKARVTRLSLRQAESLLDINRKKVEVGLLASIDVLEAQAEVAARQSQLITDLQSINSLQDDLKRRLRIRPGQQMWNYMLLPTEVPAITSVECDVRACLADAYNRRPEIETIRHQARNLEQTELVRRNAVLPSLDAFYSYGLQGLDHSPSGAAQRASSAEDKGWGGGVEFSFPLQNRQARYQLKQVQKRIEQLRLNYQSQLETVAQQVRLAFRVVQAARDRADTSRAQTEYEAAKLDAEIKRYENGIATSQDVLDYQNDLASARVNYLSSLVIYHQALIGLDFATGLILEKNHIIESEAE